MATYTGTMYVGGDTTYNDTAKGYQIAGNDAASANATIQLPSTYALYENSRIVCTLYSATAPSSWESSWGCSLGVYLNDELLGSDTQWINKNHFSDGSGVDGRSFSVSLDGGEFEAGDTITIVFNGADGGYVDSSNRCVYLTRASFVANTVSYELSFSANNGSGAPSAVTGEVNNSGEAVIEIPSTIPTRDGYTFLGWTIKPTATSAAYEPGDDIEITKNTKLYAVWKEIVYTVTYDDNGADSGEAPTDDTEYSSGATAIIAGNTGDLVREGYVFAGWNTAADGTGVAYMAGDSVTMASALTLYAVWVLDEQVYIYTGTVWQKGDPQIFNGTTWQLGELSLYANNNWNS